MDEGRRIFLAFLAGFTVALAAQALVFWVRARRRRDLESEPPRPALFAISYRAKPRRTAGSRPTPGIETFVAALALLLMPGNQTWQTYLWGAFALLVLPGTWNDLREFARRLTVRAVIAAYDEGLYLTGWRETVFLPWREVAAAYTDPPGSGGYVPDEQNVTLHLQSRSGRSWRYSSREFEDGAPAEFDHLVQLVTVQTAPPDSMLTRPTL
jgi:hypothetical protein